MGSGSGGAGEGRPAKVASDCPTRARLLHILCLRFFWYSCQCRFEVLVFAFHNNSLHFKIVSSLSKRFTCEEKLKRQFSFPKQSENFAKFNIYANIHMRAIVQFVQV